jgi:hypothetical protein
MAIVAGLVILKKCKRRKGKQVEGSGVSEVFDPGLGPYEMACPDQKQNRETLHEIAA